VAELTQKGHDVSLWNRSAATIASYQEIGGVSFEGALGEGKAMIRLITTDLGEALDGAELAVVCLPAVAHEEVALAMAKLSCNLPIILDPGGTGGALLFRRAFNDEGAPLPPIVEMSRSPKSVIASVRGIGVAVITMTCGVWLSGRPFTPSPPPPVALARSVAR